MNSRLQKFTEKMTEKGVDAVLIVQTETKLNKNLFYLSGFTGEAGILLVRPDKALLFVDGRFPEQAREEVFEDIEVQLTDYPQFDFLAKMIDKDCVKALGIEENIVSYTFYNKLAERIPNIVFRSVDGVTETIRIIKTSEEIERIKEACRVADESYTETIKLVKPGVTERDLAAELDYQMKRKGAKKAGFDTIIASGYRAAMAHGVASSKKLEIGEFVVFDWGALVNNYCSDCTRTIVIGEPTPRHLEIYNLVRRAQETAMGFFRPGVKGVDADKAARDIINAAGYEKNFNHSLGHGLGVEVHENPRASTKSEEIFEANMVCTNEPGVYFEGWGGVRIEDSVWITPDGGIPLTKLSKDLIVIE